MTAEIIRGDALALPLGDASVDLVVTSPPYFGLRSYQDGGEHYEGQIGSEATPAEFVEALVAATREMVRVLKPSGSIFVNLGDSYVGRSLTGTPWRYALRCIDALSLTLRAEIVWEKTNAYIDARASDRVRRSHEAWFHLSPTRTPFADGSAIAVRAEDDYTARPQYRRAQQLFEEAGFEKRHRDAVKAVGNIDTRGGQVRSGGSWSSQAGQLAAEVRNALGSYYRELCGTPNRARMPGSVRTVAAYPLKVPKSLGLDGHFASFPVEWPAWIIAAWCPEGGTVLDPFGGTGTTALAADLMGRRGISVDMSADYCRIAEWRTNDPKEIAKAKRKIREATERRAA